MSPTMMDMTTTMMMDMTMDCPMASTFEWTTDECVLFHAWKINNNWQYSICIIMIVLVCILRQHMPLLSNKNFCTYTNFLGNFRAKNDENNEEKNNQKKDEDKHPNASYNIYEDSSLQELLQNPTDESLNNTFFFKKFFAMHISSKLIRDSIISAVVLFIDYCIMLLLMCYNYGFAIAIICGLCVGRFLVYPKLQSRDTTLINHCNLA